MVNAIVVVAGCAAALAPGGDMRSVSELFGQFVDPSREFRIAPLLRTNDHVTRDEIRWQVRAMKEAGCGGTFTYCERMSGGFPHDFLSAEWWQAVRWTAEACAEEGLDFWVYDDEDWPSGRAGDQLVAEHPEWSWHYLSVEPHSFHGPGPCTLTLPEDGVMAVVAYQVKDDRVVADSRFWCGDCAACRAAPRIGVFGNVSLVCAAAGTTCDSTAMTARMTARVIKKPAILQSGVL